MKKKENKQQKERKMITVCLFYQVTLVVFQDFQNYLRTEIDLVEDVTRLVLDDYISGFLNMN